MPILHNCLVFEKIKTLEYLSEFSNSIYNIHTINSMFILHTKYFNISNL